MVKGEGIHSAGAKIGGLVVSSGSKVICQRGFEVKQDYVLLFLLILISVFMGCFYLKHMQKSCSKRYWCSTTGKNSFKEKMR